MSRHLNVILVASLAILAAFVFAFMQGWFFTVYALACAMTLGSFIYLTSITRFDGRPSEEELSELEHHSVRPL